MREIPKSLFTTKDIEPSQRFGAFRESMGVIFEVSEPSKTGEEFVGNLRSYLLGELLLADCQATGQIFRRTPQMIASDGVDHFLFQVFYRGSTRQQNANPGAVCVPGKVIVIDAAQPWDAINDDFHNLSLVIPRRLLSDHLLQEYAHHGRVLGVDDPFGIILINYIFSLAHSVERMTSKDINGITKMSTEIVTIALNSASHASADHPSEKQLDSILLKGRIKQHLENNLHDPGLDVDSVANVFGISRSQLYRVFDAEGGIANYLRNRRLDLAFKRIAAAGDQGEEIIDIAYSLGYTNASAFRRAFKQKFEIGPSEVAKSNSSSLTITNCDEQRVWEQWFLGL